MSIPPERRAIRSTVLAFSIAGAAGCHGCGDHKPYTPFQLDAGTSASVAAPAKPPRAIASGDFVPVAATAASGTRFDLDGTNIDAPAGHTFRSALPIDADGDGTSDLLAWLDASNGGELWFVPGKDKTSGATLTKLPEKLGTPGCKRDVDLQKIGRMTVLALVTADCEGEASSWFAIVRLHDGAPPEIRLDGSAGAVPAGETLSFAFDAGDRDKDGVDDLTIHATLEGLGDPFDASGKVSVPIFFVDRPAGLARDASEPETSLAKEGATVIGKAKVAKLAGDALAHAARTLRLATYVCDELGAPVLTTSAGRIRCGDVGFVGDSIYGVALAAITKKDWGAALAARDLLAKAKQDPRKRGAALDKSLAQSIPKVDAVVLHHVTAPVKSDGILSPLSFDADGNLLVVSGDAVVSVKAQGFAEESSPAVPWPLTLAWHDADMDFHVVSAARTCSPRALVIDEEVGDSKTRALLPDLEAALPPKTSPCVEGPIALSTLLVSGGHAVLAAGSETFEVESRGSGIKVGAALPPDAKAPPSLPGQSRAVDGSAIALPTAGGIVVITAAGAKRWMSDELAGAEKCAVQPGARRAACVTPRGAVLVETR